MEQAATAPYTVSTFYKFTPIDKPRSMRDALKRAMIGRGIRGTITLSPEGINATIAGKTDLLFDMLKHLKSLPQIGEFTHKESINETMPFLRTKVKVKPQLISLGTAVDPTVCVGTYVDAKDWNALITRDDVITIDTRNDYEYRVGHFKGAINPNTRNFKEMVTFTETHLNPAQHPHVAMYCTGGIRCEKYSSYLLERGFKHVYHLNGGILQYLQDIPEPDSLWQGTCFVFDWRVAVKHDLSEDKDITMCLGCGNPLTPQDRQHPAYRDDRSHCDYCEKT